MKSTIGQAAFIVLASVIGSANAWQAVCSLPGAWGAQCSGVAQAQVLGQYMLSTNQPGAVRRTGDNRDSHLVSTMLTCMGLSREACTAQAECTFVDYSAANQTALGEQGMCVFTTRPTALDINVHFGDGLREYTGITTHPTQALMKTCLVASSLNAPATVPAGCTCCTVPNIYGFRTDTLTGASNTMSLCGPTVYMTHATPSINWCTMLNIGPIVDPLSGVSRTEVPATETTTATSSSAINYFSGGVIAAATMVAALAM